MSPGRSLGSVEPNAILVFTTAIAISVDKFVLSKWTGAGAAALRLFLLADPGSSYVSMQLSGGVLLKS